MQQRPLEDFPMLLFGAVVAACRTPLEFPYDGFVDLTDHELSHLQPFALLAMLAAASTGGQGCNPPSRVAGAILRGQRIINRLAITGTSRRRDIERSGAGGRLMRQLVGLAGAMAVAVALAPGATAHHGFG